MCYVDQVKEPLHWVEYVVAIPFALLFLIFVLGCLVFWAAGVIVDVSSESDW